MLTTSPRQLDGAGASRRTGPSGGACSTTPWATRAWWSTPPSAGASTGLGAGAGHALRERTGVEVEVQTNDDGILLRFPLPTSRFPLDLVTALTPAEARERLLRAARLAGSSARSFARTPPAPCCYQRPATAASARRSGCSGCAPKTCCRRSGGSRISRSWRRPIGTACEDVLDLPHLEEVLARYPSGRDRSGQRWIPRRRRRWRRACCGTCLGLYLYEWDTPKAERQLQTLAANRDLLQELLQDVDLSDLLRSEAVVEVRSRLQHTAAAVQVRTIESTGFAHSGAMVLFRDGAFWPLKACGLPSLVTIVPRMPPPDSSPASIRSRLRPSHCGGIANLKFPLSKRTSATGRALPFTPTKLPTSVRLPDRLTSNQEGTAFPFSSIVMSQRPIKSFAVTVS